VDTKILLSALQEVEKRAERVSEDDVLATYVNVESLTAALGAKDNGIVFGRRGTGKTHALKYVAQTEREGATGSPTSTWSRTSAPPRAATPTPTSALANGDRLVVDVLSIVHTQLLAAPAGNVKVQIDVLDRMLDNFQEVLVATETEQEDTEPIGRRRDRKSMPRLDGPSEGCRR
jgi:hypothetical protein